MQFLPLYEYLDAARKMLIKYGRNPNDEDAISYVAHYMMKADEHYDGKTGSRFGFRAMNGKFGIMNYYNRKKKPLQSLYAPIGDDMQIVDVIENDDLSIIDKCQFNEIMSYIKNTDTMSNNQKKCITMYIVDGMTLDDIGNTLDMTKEGVRLNVIKGVKKLENKFSV